LKPVAGGAFAMLQSAGMGAARGLAVVTRMTSLVSVLIAVGIVIGAAVLLFRG